MAKAVKPRVVAVTNGMIGAAKQPLYVRQKLWRTTFKRMARQIESSAPKLGSDTKSKRNFAPEEGGPGSGDGAASGGSRSLVQRCKDAAICNECSDLP